MVVQDRICTGLPATAQQLIIDYLELVDKSRPLWGFYWPLLRVHDAALASSCVVTIPWWKTLLEWPHRNFIMSLLWIVSYISWLYLWNPAVLQTKVGRRECRWVLCVIFVLVMELIPQFWRNGPRADPCVSRLNLKCFTQFFPAVIPILMWLSYRDLIS
jgi:hypothetical protein